MCRRSVGLCRYVRTPRRPLTRWRPRANLGFYCVRPTSFQHFYSIHGKYTYVKSSVWRYSSIPITNKRQVVCNKAFLLRCSVKTTFSVVSATIRHQLTNLQSTFTRHVFAENTLTLLIEAFPDPKQSLFFFFLFDWCQLPSAESCSFDCKTWNKEQVCKWRFQHNKKTIEKYKQYWLCFFRITAVKIHAKRLCHYNQLQYCKEVFSFQTNTAARFTMSNYPRNKKFLFQTREITVVFMRTTHRWVVLSSKC